MPQRIEFTVKSEHIKLLRRAYVGWEDCEFGAPAIDCKRPYGNSSVYEDMREILGAKYTKDDLYALHRGTQTALQIFIALGRMEAGVYVSLDYGATWTQQVAFSL